MKSDPRSTRVMTLKLMPVALLTVVSGELIGGPSLMLIDNRPKSTARNDSLISRLFVVPAKAGTQAGKGSNASPLFMPGAGSGPPLSRGRR